MALKPHLRGGMGADAKGWAIEEGVWDGSELRNVYRYDGVIAIRHKISSRISKQLGGYQLIYRDIRNIRSWILIIKKVLPDVEVPKTGASRPMKREGDVEKNNMLKAMFVAVLSIYGKLFTAAGGRNVSLHDSIIKDPRHRHWHEELMELRHSFAAHSGRERNEQCDVVVALAPTGKSLEYRLFTELKQPNSPYCSDYDEIDSLMQFLAEWVVAKRDSLLERIRAEDLSAEELKSIVGLYSSAGVIARPVSKKIFARPGSVFKQNKN